MVTNSQVKLLLLLLMVPKHQFVQALVPNEGILHYQSTTSPSAGGGFLIKNNCRGTQSVAFILLLCIEDPVSSKSAASLMAYVTTKSIHKIDYQY